MPEWVTEDVLGVGAREATDRAEFGSTGVLRNPDFPSAVSKDESWNGTIDAVNVGDETETFRVTKDGVTKAEFELDPGESRTVTFSGTGPTSFSIKLMRKLKKPPISKKEMAGIGLAVAIGTGLAYKFLR